MRKFVFLILSLSLCWSANLFANTYSIHNEIDKTVHWRVYGPSQGRYYGYIKVGEKPYTKDVSHSKRSHLRAYIYFRHWYDFVTVFNPTMHDLICSPNISLKANPEIHVVKDGGCYKCIIKDKNSSRTVAS